MRHGMSAELGVSPGMELTRMIPEKIQGATISYDWRTLSRAVFNDPERNGISRLDEMMSGAVRSILDRVACFLYCIWLPFTLLQIVGVTPQSSHRVLIGPIVLCRVL